MALNIYGKMKFKTQGEVKFSCTQKGRENMLEIVAFNHQIKSPRDAASGLASGKRQHMPMMITAPYDAGLPILYAALCTNETLLNAEFWFFSPTVIGERGSSTGNEVKTFMIQLENGHLSDIQLRTPNNKNPELMRYETYAEVSMTYQKITWTWIKNGVSAHDDWETPLAQG